MIPGREQGVGTGRGTEILFLTGCDSRTYDPVYLGRIMPLLADLNDDQASFMKGAEGRK